MDGNTLIQVVIFLGVAAFAAPIARMLRLGSILGYLLAGAFLGPYGIGKAMLDYSETDAEALRHIAELGVSLFLFLIGLELRPMRLWKMRESVFLGGGAQIAFTGILLVGLLYLVAPTETLSFPRVVLIGVALALSSTAFALQTLEEKGELTTRHGRLSFSILLFQDLAAIPLIAIIPVLAHSGAGSTISVLGAAKAFGAIALVIFAGRYVLDRLYRVLASSNVREAMTASALLTVASVALLMNEIGLSASIGAFLAGVLLADSPFRHQLEADIEPFEMLLLALFFTSIGMGLNYQVLLANPGLILGGVAVLVALKMAVLYGIGRWQGLNDQSSRRLAIVTSQGGEFAFVVFTAAQQGGILPQSYAESLGIIVTLSMVTTPILLGLDDFFRNRVKKRDPDFDTLPKRDSHVVIAGFGRVGQIVGRILRAKGIPFTALDIDPDQINFVNQFGNKIYYGDASRLSILEAAETNKARAFVLAIDDVEKSLKTAQLVRTYFPHVPIIARARNRKHVHQLMDLGVKYIERETFLSSLEITRDLLRKLGLPEGEIRFIVETFKDHDEQRVYEDYEHYTDMQKVKTNAMKRSEELAEIFAKDWEAASAENVKQKAGARGQGGSKQKAAPAEPPTAALT